MYIILIGDNMKYIDELKRIVIGGFNLIGKSINEKQFYIEFQDKPHFPKALGDGKMAVYMFLYNDKFLKIGIADKNSSARYQSQHYSVRGNSSTLAKSLVEDERMSDVNERNVKEWIMNNCQRYNIILDAEVGSFALSLIEGLLHHKYMPVYEGSKKKSKEIRNKR